jgi:hypothetical protein
MLGHLIVGDDECDVVTGGLRAWHMLLLDGDGQTRRGEFLPFRHRRGGKLVSDNATFTLRGDGFLRPAGWVLESSDGWLLRALVRAPPRDRERIREEGASSLEEWKTRRITSAEGMKSDTHSGAWKAGLGSAAFSVAYHVRLAGSVPALGGNDILAIAFASWFAIKWLEAQPILVGG